MEETKKCLLQRRNAEEIVAYAIARQTLVQICILPDAIKQTESK